MPTRKHASSLSTLETIVMCGARLRGQVFTSTRGRVVVDVRRSIAIATDLVRLENLIGRRELRDMAAARATVNLCPLCGESIDGPTCTTLTPSLVLAAAVSNVVG